MLWLNVLLFVVATAALVKSGDWALSISERIAKLLRIREFVLAFMLLAISTSLPELFVAITSSVQHSSELILGTVIGSNIANIALVVGVAALLARGLKINIEEVRRDSRYMIIAAAAPILLLLDGNLSRVDGLLLISIFGFYMWRIYKQRTSFPEPAKKEKGKTAVESATEFGGTVNTSIKQFALLGGSFVALFISANFVVKYALLIATDLNIPTFIVGVFIVAFGTSLPELVLSARAAVKGKASTVIGTNIGSVVANSTLILGVAALILPLHSDGVLTFASAGYMLLTLGLFVFVLERDDVVSVKEGMSLIVLYIVFLMVEFLLSGSF